MAAYDFPLEIHSNHGPTSYHSRDKWQFQSKIGNFPTIVLPLELGNIGWSQKTRMMVLPGWERSLTISLAFWIQYTNVTHRRMGGHQLTAKTVLTHSITW